MQQYTASGRGAGALQLTAGHVLRLTLVRNQDDRPRYVTLVTYEQRWVPVGDPVEGVEALRLIPVRRTYGWVSDNEGEAFMCIRVTELRYRDLKPSAAHREFVEGWVRHVKEQLAKLKRGGPRPARPVRVEVVP